MAYCGPRGIPYTEFLAWDDLSRDAALAWSQREARRCRCGHIPSEWRQYDEHGMPVLDANGAHLEAAVKPFVPVPEYCPACGDSGMAMKASKHADNPGFRMMWAPNPDYVEPPDPSEVLSVEPAES